MLYAYMMIRYVIRLSGNTATKNTVKTHVCERHDLLVLQVLLLARNGTDMVVTSIESSLEVQSMVLLV